MSLARAARSIAVAWLAGALLAPAPAAARRIFVPKEHRSVQAAIDAAAAGDTVWVAAGVYHGPIRITKRLVVFGDGGSEATILDGGDSTRVVHVEGVNGGHLLGFTIRRGKAPGGGGVSCVRDTNYSITSCVFEKNWEAGLALWQCPIVGLTDDTFRENQGSGLTVTFSKVYLRDSQFSGNHAQSGGGASFVNSEAINAITNCEFNGNRAEGGQGGGVFADSSITRFTSCAFIGNSSTRAGGAAAAVDSSTLWSSRCRFQENQAATGGAINADASNLNIAFTIFDRNRATAAASAIQVLGRAVANVNPIIRTSTFYKNTCTAGEGAAIFCLSVSPEIQQDIFVTEGINRAVVGTSSTPRFECNLIWDPTGAAIGALPSKTTYVGDPHFCDPEKHDFHVSSLSLALLAPCGVIGAQGKGCSTFQLAPAR